MLDLVLGSVAWILSEIVVVIRIMVLRILGRGILSD